MSTSERTPDVVHAPRDEAAWIIAGRQGVAGEQAPRGFLDGGAVGPVIAAMMPRLAPPEPGM